MIGRELVELLKAEGADIRAVDMVERPEFLRDVEYFRSDLSDPSQQYFFRFSPDYIFHLAADFERSQEDLLFWQTNFLNNILASHYLLEKSAVLPTVKKIIFASSYLIYDKNLYKRSGKTGALSELSAVNPRNICGVAKLQTERDLEFFWEKLDKKFDVVSARIFRVYGRGSRDIISRWVRMGICRQILEVFESSNSFDYIYAGDVAEGLLRLGACKRAVGIVNLGTGRGTTIKTVVECLKKEFSNLKVKEISKSIYPESSLADISLLQKLTGWRPTVTIERGIKNIISHEKQERKTK